MTIQLIVIDMDETFLRADKTYNQDKASTIFSKLEKQGVVVAIASGNFVPLLESYFEDDILKDVYLAGDDGNVLQAADEIIRTLPLEPSDAEDVYHFSKEKNGYYPIISTGKHAYVRGPVNEWADEQIRLYFGDYTLIDSFDDVPNPANIAKMEMLSEHPLDENKQVMDQIEEDFPGVSSVTSGDEWLDIYHKDGGKGEAVKFLQDKYEISKEETMCFGDSLNDLSMMKEAKYSMAMKNADEDLKVHCSYEIGSNEEQSVLAILEEFIEKEYAEFLEAYKK